MLEYVSAVMVASAHTLYHTAVVTAGSAATLVIAIRSADWTDVGTAAKVVAEAATLLLAEVGLAPNPPTPSTRWPQVFTDSAIGVVWFPVLARILLPPEARALLAAVSPSFNV